MNISVIIPAWNAERHIGRAIRSVLAQTLPAQQILVVDDGSSDGTAEAVRAFGASVQLICQPNGGASIARNTALAAATGDWIAFLDADDEWMPEKLSLQAAFHQQHPQVQWSFTRLEWAHPAWKRHRLAHPEGGSHSRIYDDYLAAYRAGFFMSTITVMAHRSVFDAVGVFEPGMKRAQDSDLWFRIAYRFPQVGYLPQSLAVYHLDTPDSSTKINDQVEFMIDLIERHCRLSAEAGRGAAFDACVPHMLQVWIRQLVRQRRRQDAQKLLDRFSGSLSGRFCREMSFRMNLPWAGPLVADLYDRLKHKRRTTGGS